MGPVTAKIAFSAYAALALLSIVTLDGDTRIVSLAVLALFAVKTCIDIMRRRIEARETVEASAAAPPTGDVGSGHDA